MEIISFLLQISLIFNYAFAIVIVFFEKKNPSVTWAWILVLLVLPYVGFLIYLIIGMDARKHFKFAKKSHEDELFVDEILKKKFSGLDYQTKGVDLIETLDFYDDLSAVHLQDLMVLNYTSAYSAVTTNNELKLFHNGSEKFGRLFEDIKNAKSHIHLLYYILRPDDLGKKLIAVLAKKASEGVEVKLLVDGMGCFFSPKSFYKPLKDAGGEVGIFVPPYFIRINYRNHRKIAVIDGTIGYIGGFNIGDEYMGKVKRFGKWRDSHVRIHGDAVKDLEMRFVLDWNYASKNKFSPDETYFPVIEKRDGVPIQIVSSGPDTEWSSVYYGYAKMISEADKSIYIQTPYFVPDDNLLESLKIAALSGIDVRIMIPANPDHVFVYWASLSYLGELLEAGVKCYEYTNGFIHSKLIMIDGCITSAGTANMDIRSFKLNFEVNAFIYDKSTAEKFISQFEKDLTHCDEITLESYAKRGKITKVKEAFSRLISPLL